MEDSCWFCTRVIEATHAADDHHVIPKRHGGKEKVRVHKLCHLKFNREHDKSWMDKEKFLTYLKAIDFGEGIFRGA